MIKLKIDSREREREMIYEQNNRKKNAAIFQVFFFNLINITSIVNSKLFEA